MLILFGALCLVKPTKNVFIFAGAKLPLYYVYDGQIKLIKGDRQSLGYKRAKDRIWVLNKFFTINNTFANAIIWGEVCTISRNSCVTWVSGTF
jgi:hypothetical protein